MDGIASPVLHDLGVSSVFADLHTHMFDSDNHVFQCCYQKNIQKFECATWQKNLKALIRVKR